MSDFFSYDKQTLWPNAVGPRIPFFPGNDASLEAVSKSYKMLTTKLPYLPSYGWGGGGGETKENLWQTSDY